MQRSIKNGLLFGLFGGLIGGLLGHLDTGLVGRLVGGLYIGLFVGLILGLGAAIQHYTLRFWLARSGIFPWRAVPFLEDATARILLRRVGGDIASPIDCCSISLLTRMQEHLLYRLRLEANCYFLPKRWFWQCTEGLCLVTILLSILQEVSLSQDSQVLSMIAGGSKTASWHNIFIFITGSVL